MKLPFLLLPLLAAVAPAQQPASLPVTDAEGKPLNLGFETGNTLGWTAEGTAFENQPIEGDTVQPRRGDMRSQHAGKFWVGSYERTKSDDATGRFTSPVFRVTQPWASFLVGGGNWPETRVEIVAKADGQVLHTARGVKQENMARAVVDLREHQGKEIFIRLVDERKGDWGHVNFDDFVFHAEKPNFPPAAGAKPIATQLPADVVEFAGLTAEKAAEVAVVPVGYELKVFAAEPDIINPVAFALDDRARVWAVEGMTYPNRAKEGEGKDRILIFEDTDGDGKSDKRTVFMEGLNLVSGIEVGHGGVYVGAAPFLYFIPVKNWDNPAPAGQPEVLLDGWGYQDTHETLNTFRWGPDGWLYGCHGVFTHSNVGAPGAPEAQRQKINAGVWRFHPIAKRFEVFAHGTSNPWGIDWTAEGDLMAEACVIPHLFHIIQGARYQRQAGAHFNAHTYDDIKTIADHRHYLGGNPHGGNGRSDAAGGGHAHAGLCIPQHPSWPDGIRGGVLMNNIHGARINMDVLERKGSGYVARHGADLINFKDKASQIVDLREGPNGTLFMIDWYDLNQCHRPQRTAHEYTTGRIFRLAKKGAKLEPVALDKTPDVDLVAKIEGNDPWVWRHAVRQLQERQRTPDEVHRYFDAVNPLKGDRLAQPNYPHRLISMIASLTPADGKNPQVTLQVLTGVAEALKGKIAPAVYGRLLLLMTNFMADEKMQDPIVASFTDPVLKLLLTEAKENPSPVVRLAIASACQRLTVEQRKPIVLALLAHGEDKDDQNLPFMYWYAAEPIVAADVAAAADLLAVCQLPKVEEFIARRMAGK